MYVGYFKDDQRHDRGVLVRNGVKTVLQFDHGKQLNAVSGMTGSSL